jgi:hypothetical protein
LMKLKSLFRKSIDEFGEGLRSGARNPRAVLRCLREAVQPRQTLVSRGRRASRPRPHPGSISGRSRSSRRADVHHSMRAPQRLPARKRLVRLPAAWMA